MFEIAEKDFAIHWSVDDERSGQYGPAGARDEGRHLPVTVRNFGKEALAASAASTRPGHVG